MKKITILIILIFALSSLHAQNDKGLNIGFSFQPMISTLKPYKVDFNINSKNEYLSEIKESLKPFLGYELSFGCDIRLMNNIWFFTGLKLINRGYKSDGLIDYYENYTKQSDYYISIPIHIGYNLFDYKKSSLFITAGVSIDLLLYCISYDIHTDLSTNESYSHKIYWNYSRKIPPNIPISLGLKYQIPVKEDIDVFINPQFSIFNTSFYLANCRYITYGIGLGIRYK